MQNTPMDIVLQMKLSSVARASAGRSAHPTS